MAEPPPPDLTRRERRKLEVRSRILDAAFELFEQRGFAATRVVEICELADVAHKTFFNHFATKQELLRAVAGAGLEQLLSDIEDARKQPGSTRERLAVLFERISDNSEKAGPMHRELLTEMVHVAHETGTESEQAEKLHEAFGAIVRDGRASGDISCDHGEQTQTELVLGSFYALMFDWAHLEGYPLRRQARSMAKLLGDALCGRPQEDRT